MIIRSNSQTEFNPFWDSKPELFSDIACLRIPYQSCIVLFENFFSGTSASNRRELRLHLNVVSTGAGVFKSRYILLHKYVNRIMITYLWRQIQLIIPSRCGFGGRQEINTQVKIIHYIFQHISSKTKWT
jgi:hypothetical protein